MMKQMGKESEIRELENQRKVFNLIQMQNMQKLMQQKMPNNQNNPNQANQPPFKAPAMPAPITNVSIQNVNINNMSINIHNSSVSETEKTTSRKGSNIPNIKELMSHKSSMVENESVPAENPAQNTLPKFSQFLPNQMAPLPNLMAFNNKSNMLPNFLMQNNNPNNLQNLSSLISSPEEKDTKP